MAKDTVLRCENLSIGYKADKKTVIVSRDINFQIGKGQLIGLIGPNGIGKSTLLKTISGNVSPLGGNIYYNDLSIGDYSALQLSKILSLVLTEQLISKNLSVKELIALGRQPYTNWLDRLSSHDKKKISMAIELANISDFVNKKCYELSDGQMQIALIARAISQDTELIILDEPTTHLDIYHKAYIMRLLRRLSAKNNKAILFATHDIELSIQLCDYLLIMTNDTLLFDTPNNHISNGVFHRLFPSDLIEFDSESSRFKIKQ